MSTGDNFFRNQAIIDPSFRGKAFGSNVVNLQGDQSVDYPIVHQLGSEELSANIPTETEGHTNVTFSASANNAFNLAVSGSTGSALNPRVQNTTLATSLSGKILLSFNALINSGICNISYIDIYGTQINVAHLVTSGRNELMLESVSASNVHKWYFDGTQDFNVEITEWSIKEITVNNSYATYLDYGTLKHKSISSTGDVGEELVVNGDFSDGLNGWTLGEHWTVTDFARGVGVGSDTLGTKISIIDEHSYLVMSNVTNLIGDYVYRINGILKDRLTLQGDMSYGFIADGTNLIAAFNTSSYGGNTTIDIDNVSVKEVLPVSTTYNLTVPHQNYFTHDIALTANEVAQLDANPNLIFEVWFSGLVLVDGFAKANMVNFLPGNEGLRGGAYLIDLATYSPAIFGNELVTNGTFDTDTTGWASSSAEMSVDNERLKVQIVDGTTNGGSDQNTTGKLNTQYRFEYTVEEGDSLANGYKVVIGTFKGGSTIYASGDIVKEYGSFSVNIISDASDTDMHIVIQTNDVNSYTFFDNISLREIISEATGFIEINNYTESARLDNQLKGSSNLLVEQDSSGRSVGVVPSGQIAVDGSNKNVNTGWNISGSRWTIKQTVSGLLQDFNTDSKQSATSVPSGVVES